MNKERRNRADKEAQRVYDISILLQDESDKVIDLIEDIALNVEQILDEEQYAFDSMPENLQNSTRGCTSEECMDALEEAGSLLEELKVMIKSKDLTMDDADELIDEIYDKLQDVACS